MFVLRAVGAALGASTALLSYYKLVAVPLFDAHDKQLARLHEIQVRLESLQK